METATHSSRPAKLAVADLLRSRGYADAVGNVNFERFYQEVEKAGGGYGAKHLRRMIDGARPLKPAAIEAVAELLAVDPAYFREYRLWQIEQAMERNPEVVDAVYEIAMGFEEAKGELGGGGRRKKVGGA